MGLAMRHILAEQRIHPALREKIFAVPPIVSEVEAAIAQHEVVLVGMRQNPFPRRARRLLDAKGIHYHYLEYGSYFTDWRKRLSLKLWTGWSTFPMIFVRGILIGGYQDLERLLASGEFAQLLSGAAQSEH
jgi:monothiol glutaredoxin